MFHNTVCGRFPKTPTATSSPVVRILLAQFVASRERGHCPCVPRNKMLPAFVVSIRNVLDLAAEGALDLLGEFAKVVGVRFFECVADCWQIFSEDSLVRSCSAATERARVHRLQDWNELSDDPGETMAFCGLSVGARVARPCAAMWLTKGPRGGALQGRRTHLRAAHERGKGQGTVKPPQPMPNSATPEVCRISLSSRTA